MSLKPLFRYHEALILIALVICFALNGCRNQALDPPAPAIALWIDNAPVTMVTFLTHIEVTRQTWSIENTFSPEEHEAIVSRTIRDLVEERVLQQAAEEMGITVNREELFPDIPEIRKYPEGFGLLEESEQQWQERVQDRMEIMAIASRIADRLVSDVSVTETDLRELYNRSMDRFTEPETLELRIIRVYDPDLAEDIHAKLKKGWKFSRLAEIYSNLRGESAGGERVRKRIGEFSEQFEKELMGLKPGQVSPILTSQEGYFIYQLEKRIPPSVLPFEQVHDRLRNESLATARARIFQEWLEEKAGKTVVTMGTPVPFPGE
ncbi:peptidyl-prolyl cis-trans isomerase [bacterium]|nr:peptidyl-prolyl cis-trans isomerase [candidate division CSSED10-310 bacterium]